MSTIASLNVDLTASTAQFKIAMDKATQQLDHLGGKSDSLMSKLKESFGRGSTFGQFAKLFAGGGAIIGLSIATRELEKMTAEGAKLADEFREGKISGGEMATGLAESIPVLGNIVKAGADIVEMFTGDALALRQANEEAKKLEDVTVRMHEAFSGGASSAQHMSDIIGDLKNKIDAIGGTKNAFTNVFGSAGGTLGSTISVFAKDRESILNPKGGPSLIDLQKQAADLQKQIIEQNASLIHTTGPKMAMASQAIFGLFGMQGAKVGDTMPAGYSKEINQKISELQEQRNTLNIEIANRRRSAMGGVPGLLGAVGLVGVDLAATLGHEGKTSAMSFWDSFSKFTLSIKGGGVDKALETRTEDLFKRASGVFEKTRTPAEKLAEEMSDINAMVAVGAINWDTYARAATDANIEFAKAIKSPEMKSIKLQPTVQPAREFRFTEGIPGGRSNPLEQLQPIIKDNNKATQENTREIKEQNRILRNGRQASENIGEPISLLQ